MRSAYIVDKLRWSKLDIFNQMGNIYSEAGRSLKARDSHDLKTRDAAIRRAVDLFDMTVDILITRKSYRVKEVLRAKDQYLSVMYGTQESIASVQSLDRYFQQFAIAARLHR